MEKSVPKDAIHLYKMMWQFEKWLRVIVYVELYARDNNWKDAIAHHKPKDWPPSSIKSDKKFTHMVTAHQNAISFITLSELWNVISDSNNWMLFEKYFPPQDITNARIKEIKNIRNRIMHFREPHENDVIRMLLFLKDFEPGVRLFCQSYTTEVFKDKEDALVKLLTDHWDRIGYKVELYHLKSGYLYAPQPHTADPKFGAVLRLIRRPWSGANGEGLLYEISMRSLRRVIQNDSIEDFRDYIDYELDFEEMLRATKDVHDKCIHISIKGDGNFSALFPAHLGVETNFTIIDTILTAGVNCRDRPKMSDHEIEKLSRQTPEYILWPDTPIFRYDDLISENLINLDL